MPFYSCETDHISITMSTTVVLMNIGINLLFLELAVIRMKAVKLL